MSNIVYNEQQEAFELPYKLWDKMMTVRFYTENEQNIIDNLSSIAMQLESVNGGKTKISGIIVDEGLYNGAEEILSKYICLESIYVDIDDDEIVVCFTVSSSDGYMEAVDIELYNDEFEIISRN